jgi:hypothetical protein
VTVESESLRTLTLSWLAEGRWPNVLRVASDRRRLWWDKVEWGVLRSIRPWRVPGGVPLVKSMSLLAAIVAAVSIFRREDDRTSSSRAGRIPVRSVSVGVSYSLNFIVSGADCTLYTSQRL